MYSAKMKRSGNLIRIKGTTAKNLSESEMLNVLYNSASVGFLLTEIVIVGEHGNRTSADSWYDSRS